ncbi:uncharacterized protein LOC107470527 [Arachis duranensis]|uniref:Uncharacterized protein LOC107470527 n=1 Tax=Arachis duranensis TaxID=130453 RepID=A0A6P4BNZ6_ARADU|nr:uncharacterized protein LOC107470527 [Arachis duranensis]
MCVDFTDLNKACPKDSYHLPSIDCLIDNASGFEKLSFMDAYSGYNQIQMHPSDQNKTAFITEYGNYCYKVMPFGLKNAGATYQRLMDKVFAKQIGRNIEVYVDDMVAKAKTGNNHLDDLAEIFGQLRTYNMRLNPEKCTFGVQSGKFLGFLLTSREFDIKYEGRTSIKSQFLADFIAEFSVSDTAEDYIEWSLYVDGSSNPQGCGAGIILDDAHGNVIEHSLHFSFKASNNQSEYEALIAGLRLAADLNITELKVYCDFLLIVQQHIPRESNGRADILSKLASTQPNRSSLYQSILLKPSIELTEIISVTQEADWRSPYMDYLQTGNLPGNVENIHHFRRQASYFIVYNNCLYRRGFSRPLLKCLCRTKAELALAKAHEGIYDILGPFPTVAGQVKFLVAIDYFSKWIEAHPLAKITSQQMLSFIWKYIICRFDIPRHIITDNGRQFADQKFTSFLQDLKIKQHFSSVEHPQTNGLAEAANKVILHALRKKLDEAKGLWAELIPEIIWGYNTVVHSTTKETPFRLVYGSDAMIPVEISQSSLRIEFADQTTKDTARRTELDLAEEVRSLTAVKHLAMQQHIARRYNKRLQPRSFQVHDLVLRKTEQARKPLAHGKLSANWEGPYRVTEVIGNGAYRLQTLEGKDLPNTCNVSSLKLYNS